MERTLITPPYPRPSTQRLGIRGLLAMRQTNVLQIWSEEAYEVDIQVGEAFGRQTFLLNDPAAIRRVLIDNHLNYRRTRVAERILHPILGDGLFFAEGDDWRAQRRTLAPSFGPRAAAGFADAMIAATEEIFAAIRPDETGVDLLALFQVLTLDIAGRTMFSLEMRRRADELRGLVEEYGQYLAAPTLLDFLLPRFLPSPRDIKRRMFRRRWRALIEQLMAERSAAASADAPRDLFDQLLAARDPETGAGFTPGELRDQVATLLLAGHETTALALFWAAYLLTLSPAAQDKVAAEAAAAQAGDLEKLPFTRSVVDEALRLYPPAFTIVREARREDRIGTLRIPSGSMIMISPWVLHRHRRLWTAPNAFDPDRFLPGAGPVDRFAYLPFGIGPRVCIGAQFALTEATLVLARLARTWRISPVSPYPVTPYAIVTTFPDHAPRFYLDPRNSPPRRRPRRRAAGHLRVV